MRAITQYLKCRELGTVEDSFYMQIENWQKWYKGKTAFHTYRQYNGKRRLTRERKSLGMAKMVCEDWANLALNEKVEIVIDDKSTNDAVAEVLNANNFRVKGNQLLELAFALGMGALVEYKEKDTVKIDYIRAGMIYPLRWDNGKIIDCAFGSVQTEGKKQYVYLNIHQLQASGYVIENKMFLKGSGNALTQVDLPEGVQEIMNTKSSIPHFQLIQPNLVNNIDLDCPMGISIFANAIDQLEDVDMKYDSYHNEFRLGKKRIMVPITMARQMMEEDGQERPVFDDNDTEFYAFTAAKDGDQTIQEINMELRAEEHEAAIKTALNLLAAKCGLGNDRYSFERGNMKTATEVISEKSELFQNLKKHELVLEPALKEMTRAIADVLGISTGFEVNINFDDSIIEDTNAQKQQFLQEIRDGVRQKYEYRMRFFGEDVATAKKMVTVVTGESEGGWFQGGGVDA